MPATHAEPRSSNASWNDSISELISANMILKNAHCANDDRSGTMSLLACQSVGMLGTLTLPLPFSAFRVRADRELWRCDTRAWYASIYV